MLIKLLKNNRIVVSVFVFLLFLPQFLVHTDVRANSPWTDYIGLPRLFSGDEPHYMVILSSILNDRDLNVKNNYDSILKGSEQAGRAFKNVPLDFHVAYRYNGRPHPFAFITEYRRGPEGLYYTFKPSVPEWVKTAPAYSIHPPWVPAFLSAFTFPFAGTTWVEPIAILMSAIMTLLAFFAFRYLLAAFTSSPVVINVISLGAFLGTPVWHYSRSLFTEPYGVAFLIFTYAFAIRNREHPLWGAALPGLFMGLAMLVKIPFAIVGLPLGVLFLMHRDWKKAALYAIGPLCAVGGFMLYNYIVTGSPASSHAQAAFRTPFTGAFHLLFHKWRGILPYSPVVLLALWGWWKLWRNPKRDPYLMLIGVVSLLWFVTLSLLSGNWDNDTGYQFAYRHFIPVIGFVMVGLLPFFKESKKGLRIQNPRLLAGLLGLSILINAMGTIPYWSYWRRHPIIEFSSSSQ